METLPTNIPDTPPILRCDISDPDVTPRTVEEEIERLKKIDPRAAVELEITRMEIEALINEVYSPACPKGKNKNKL